MGSLCTPTDSDSVFAFASANHLSRQGRRKPWWCGNKRVWAKKRGWKQMCRSHWNSEHPRVPLETDSCYLVFSVSSVSLGSFLVQCFFSVIFQFTSLCWFRRVGCHLNNCFLFLETDHPLFSLVSSGSMGPNEKLLALMKRIYKRIRYGCFSFDTLFTKS